MVKIENMINTDFKFDYDKFKIDLELLQEDECYTIVQNLDLGEGLVCKIIIYSNESRVPHFHIISMDGNFESCLCILCPRYYMHKDISILTDNQLINLEHWLSESTLVIKTTNWHQICMIWDCSNWFKHYDGEDNIRIIPIPNYHEANSYNNIIDKFYNDYYL